jgi:hypothetical protein
MIPSHFTAKLNTFQFLQFGIGQVQEFLESGELPLNAAHGAMKRDKLLLPGMAPIPAEDVWRSFQDAGHPHHQFFVRSLSRLSESSSIVVNTFEELEAETKTLEVF